MGPHELRVLFVSLTPNIKLPSITFVPTVVISYFLILLHCYVNNLNGEIRSWRVNKIRWDTW